MKSAVNNSDKLASVTIELFQKDQQLKVEVHGPLDNEMVMYYMLEKARQVVQEYTSKKGE